jgi:hypothetical protein
MAVIDWLFRNRKTGGITIAQFPNLPLWVFLGAAAVRVVFDPSGTARGAVDAVGTAALAWWAVDEVIRGVNPWRRILGGAVLVLIAARLVR